MWNLSGPGIEPMSPALAGGFLSTLHQGSRSSSLKIAVLTRRERLRVVQDVCICWSLGILGGKSSFLWTLMNLRIVKCLRCPRWSSLVAQTIKHLPKCMRPGFNPWVRKIPWRKKWQPTPVSLPGKCHGQRSLVGYSPWGHKESDTTERLHFHFQRKQSWQER